MAVKRVFLEDGGVAAIATRSIKKTKRAKGESSFQTAQRVALGNRKYNQGIKKRRS